MANTTEHLWQEYHTGLHHFIRSRISDEAAAEDILQDVFVRIHSRIGTLKNSGKLQSWIYQIARNAVIDHYRARKPLEELPESLAAPEPEADEPGRREIGGCLLPMIRALPETYREAVMLSEIEGLTQKEVAAKQGLSIPGAKARVQRGRAMMKQMLLGCCHFEFDSRGTIIDYEGRAGNCSPECDCGGDQ